MGRAGHDHTWTGCGCCLTCVASSLGLRAQVTPGPPAARRGGAAELADLLGRLREPAVQPLTQITPANVKNLELKWILPNQVFGAWQSTPLVVDGMMYVTQRPNDVLAVDAKTGRVFWQYRYTVSPDARVCCGANNRGVAILGDTLFLGTLDGAPGRPRREDRPLAVERRGRRSEARLLDHDGAARRQGQGPGRRRRRRVRHPRIHCRVRRPDRQGSVALLHDSRTRRAGARDVEGRRVEDRRRVDVADAVLRSGAEPDLLGHRQPGSRLERRPAAWRQPLHRLGRRARRRYRAS